MATTQFLSAAAIKAPAPKWATIAFRVTFLLTTALMGWVAATGLIPQGNKVEIILILKSIDPVIWGLSRLLGVVPESETPNNN